MVRTSTGVSVKTVTGLAALLDVLVFPVTETVNGVRRLFTSKASVKVTVPVASDSAFVVTQVEEIGR
jgi:hypothetical protein